MVGHGASKATGCGCAPVIRGSVPRHRGAVLGAGRRGVLQRVRDVGEVNAHRGPGPLRVVRGDRLDDFGVLGDGVLGAADHEHRAVLEAHQLCLQLGDQSGRGLVLGDRRHRGVQSRVGFGIGEQVAGLEVAAHLHEEAAHHRDVLIGRAQRGLLRDEGFQGRARLDDLDRLGLGHHPHPGTAIGFADDESLVFQLGEDDAHRRAGDAERVDQIRFDEALIGHDPPLHDVGVQSLVAFFVRRSPARWARPRGRPGRATAPAVSALILGLRRGWRAT